MRKSPLKRKTRLQAKTGFKKRATTKTKKPKRLSPKLGINLNAKQATYNGVLGTRYKGIKGVAWAYCSRYIRLRDNYTCVTCGNNTPEAQQAGHYWPIGFVGSNNRLSWDEMNIHCQCKRCNEDAGGLQKVMADYIDSKYGKELRESLDERRWKTDPVQDWEEMILFYENSLQRLHPSRRRPQLSNTTDTRGEKN